MRYLSPFDVKANLAAGRDVEQLLAERHVTEQLVIRYLSIERNRQGGWIVRL